MEDQAARRSSETAVRLKNVTKRFGDVTAVDNISLDIAQGAFVSLVGPSGCGKTTLLRMIAGLENATSGEITNLGRTVYSSERGINVPPNERNVSMVFQSYALWPNMTAFENVAFPLRRRRGDERLSDEKIREKTTEALETVHCGALSARYPSELSGGQQQRIALARAIVGSPRVVLMDEPLSNLDAKLRARLRFELRSIQRKLGFTAIYVTHDRVEAASMSDQVVVLNSGQVEQIGTPTELFDAPRTNYVSDFFSDHNLLPGIVKAHDAGQVVIDTALGPIASQSNLQPHAGKQVIVAIARSAIVISPPGSPPHPAGDGRSVQADIIGVAYCGWYSEILLNVGGKQEVTARTLGQPKFSDGERVSISVCEPAASFELAD